MTNTEKNISKCIKPIIEEIGYKLYDVIYEKEGSQNYLRVFIDKPEGISINDCENVNNAITDILDEKDFIKNAYMLEVSSPGIERRIRTDEHLMQSIGENVQIHTYKNEESVKSKEISGKLKAFDDKQICIEIEKGKEIKIDKSNISKMNTVFDWKKVEK